MMKRSSNANMWTNPHDHWPTAQKCKAQYYVFILTFIGKKSAFFFHLTVLNHCSLSYSWQLGESMSFRNHNDREKEGGENTE